MFERYTAVAGRSLFFAHDEASRRPPAGPGHRAPEHIVLVQVTIRPEMAEEFEHALLHNARESARADPGCLSFDVSRDKEHPERWVLYEVYATPEAHAEHRRSPHFLAYDAVAARAVIEKTVTRCEARHVTGRE